VLGEEGLPNGELRGPEAIALIGPSLGFDSDLLGCDGDGLRKFARLCIRKGVTTASDFANPLSDNLVKTMLETTAEPDYPIRLVSLLRSQELSGEALIQRAKVLKALSTERLRLGSVKLVADGSIQGFTARLRSGGYFNGAPNGLWYISKENLLSAYIYALKHDIQIHTHTNGDQATELVIACIKEALQLCPQDNHRFVIQHCQLADDDLLIKMKQLNVSGNFFANHVYYWGDQHAAYTVGPDRAAQMNPCASALRHGLQIAIHSDAPITPLDPLFTAWCATCRETVSGKILGPNECIQVSEAVYAITMGAAYTLGLDHEVGSLEVGKRADFAVLEQDPFMRQASFLREVSVWGTVQSGRVFQAQRPT
jgi:predicted amidohydrolase YtcJ